LKVRLSISAQQQLIAALQRLYRERPSAAVRLRSRIRTALRSIGQFPYSGRVIPEYPEFDSREIIVGPYRIFYQIRDNTIWIVGIWHGAQLPNPPDEP
jgi:toxin ParE1/3/4